MSASCIVSLSQQSYTLQTDPGSPNGGREKKRLLEWLNCQIWVSIPIIIFIKPSLSPVDDSLTHMFDLYILRKAQAYQSYK